MLMLLFQSICGQKHFANVVRIFLSFELHHLKRVKGLLVAFHCFQTSIKLKTRAINYSDLWDDFLFVE